MTIVLHEGEELTTVNGIGVLDLGAVEITMADGRRIVEIRSDLLINSVDKQTEVK